MSNASTGDPKVDTWVWAIAFQAEADSLVGLGVKSKDCGKTQRMFDGLGKGEKYHDRVSQITEI